MPKKSKPQPPTLITTEPEKPKEVKEDVVITAEKPKKKKGKN
jgi:hypothetical protein